MGPKITLPIDTLLPEIQSILRQDANLVLVAPPGAGKTTRVPPALLEICRRQILVLQPRRLAARATAARIADENQWQLGHEVGYQIRFENRTSKETRLRIVTEGILERMFTDNPYLDDVDIVILDEFHERSLHTDLCLALLHELQESVRPDLKILLMSATLDAETASRYLGGAKILVSEGKLFPIELTFETKSSSVLELSRSLPAKVGAAIETLIHQPEDDGRDILVFLPGTKEIRACLSEAENRFGNQFLLFPLHASLSSEEQDLALRPASRRKIIFSTNVAETSLTIDGVSAVVDSGLMKTYLSDARFGIDRLELGRVSLNSAEQRKGRAGRQKAGRCLRLWTRNEELQFEKAQKPEIERVDLASALLTLAHWGIKDFADFRWFEAPPLERVTGALNLLKKLGALNKDNEVTEIGKEMLRWPVHPRISRLLTAGRRAQLMPLTSVVAALLSEMDSFDVSQLSNDHSSSSDLLLFYEAYEQRRLPAPIHHRIDRLVDLFSQRQRGSLAFDEDDFLKLILVAYPDRVTTRRKEGGTNREARMVGGRGVLLEPRSRVREAQLFVSLDPFESRKDGILLARVSMASAIKESWLQEFFPQSLRLARLCEFKNDKVSAVEQKFFEDLPLGIARPVAPTADEILLTLRNFFEKNPVKAIENDPSGQQWLLRYKFLCFQRPELKWAELEDEFFLNALIDYYSGSRDSDLSTYLAAGLDYKERELLNAEAPSEMLVPSGQRHKLVYSTPENPPVLSLRLQEVFGWLESPKVVSNRIAITLELLSPSYKPVQVTRDLKSFWEKTYFEVRKELRARYPKHQWPENPKVAKAEAKGSRRRS